MLLSISAFIGRFHTLIVHLPIGILLMALLLQWLAQKKQYQSLQPAVPVLLFTGAITALFASITGYLLSLNGHYSKTLLSWHLCTGLATTITALMLYAKEKNQAFAVNKKLLSVALLLLIIITGYLGGSLAHGTDYFSKPFHDIFQKDTITTSATPQ